MVRGIVETMIAESGKYDGVMGIKEVELEVGELTNLNPEQIMFAFEVLTKDTIAEGSVLNIKEIAAMVDCSQCDYRGPIGSMDISDHYTIPSFKCPDCEGKISIIRGLDCILTSMKLNIEDDIPEKEDGPEDSSEEKQCST